MITLVQVSDIHFRSDYSNIDRLEKLLVDLREVLPKGDRAFLLLSGDIVNVGDEGEYDSFLKNFLLPASDIFAGIVSCPGNHDIQRSLNNDALIDAIAADRHKSYLYNKSGDLNLACPFPTANLQNYEEFQRLATSPALECFYGSRHEFPEATVVSLNTAWLCRRRDHNDSDRGKLRLDVPVIEDLLRASDENKLRIAMMHHPLDWLAEDCRQEIENSLTKHFDLVAFGHVHSPSSMSGTFLGGTCLFHQAPTVRSAESRGTNAYTVLRVSLQEKKFQILYRAYSVPLAKFIAGTDIHPEGIRYPTQEDKAFWDNYRSTEPSEIQRYVRSKLTEVDFSDWSRKHTPPKTATQLRPVEPKFKQLRFSGGERVEAERVGLYGVIRDLPHELFLVGPSDSGLSTSAGLALRHVCLNIDHFRCVPVYVNVSNISVNRASLLTEASKSSPVALTHRQVEALAESGELIFFIDGINLPDNIKFNHVRETVEKYFQGCKFIYLCSTDGSAKAVSEQIELRLNPAVDVVFQIDQLGMSCIRELVGLHFPEKTDEGRQALVDNIIHSFRTMDEPIYASTAVLLLDTIKQIPDFQPVNKIRLLDRYVEVILGRLDLEDVRTGSFSSTDKLVLLSYLAGHLVRNNISALSRVEWDLFVSSYSSDKLLVVPAGLLEEFLTKGILFSKFDRITFRADYLFSYFVAREMHFDPVLRHRILDTDDFFTYFREISAYGELEGVDNESLIVLVRKRLETIEELVLESYSRNGVDLDGEIDALFNGGIADEGLATLDESASRLTDLPECATPNDEFHDGELQRVPRSRGVLPRTEVRNLESRWLNTLLTFLRLLKHSENLSGSSKISHISYAFDCGEMFVKSLACKRDIVAREPAAVIDGILYWNPLAALDVERSVAEFKYSAPSSFGSVLSETISNPKLSPVFRKLASSGTDLRRYFVRRMLLDHSEPENQKVYCSDLVSGESVVLQTCSLRELRHAFVTQGHAKPRREFLQTIIESLGSSAELSALFSKKTWEKRQLLDRMRHAMNARKSGRGE